MHRLNAIIFLTLSSFSLVSVRFHLTFFAYLLNYDKYLHYKSRFISLLLSIISSLIKIFSIV